MDLREVSGQINAVGAMYMFHRDTRAFGKEHGFENPYAFYVVGRGGVLGDVDADVVASAFGFFSPSLVRTMWGIGVSVQPPREAARLFAQTCARWGRSHLSGVDGLDRLADLGEQVIEAADPTGLTLFAGWRSEPMPDDAAGRAAHVIHVLREYRGSAHLVAVVATGLKPVEAMVVHQGTERLKQFGWEEPFPEASAVRAAFAQAEAITDAIVGPAFAVLDDDESAEFAALIGAVHAAVTSN